MKNTNYTTLSNYHFKDKRLSWKAKGLLSTMLSLLDDWNYTIEGLSRLSVDGIKATNSGLLELERYGYLERKQARSDNGRFGLAEYYVYEQPMDNENAMLEEHKEKEEIPLCQKEQTVGNMPFSLPCPKRQTEKRTAEKGRQLNTNKSNTNILNPSSTEDEMQLKKNLHMQEAEKNIPKNLPMPYTMKS